MSHPDPDEEPPRGTVEPTGPRPLVWIGVVGLVGGWALRGLALRVGFAEPTVPWISIGLLAFVAALVGGCAWVTRRVVRRDRFALQHHQAVSRLALGKASAVVGALLTGGYVGYAIAQLGVATPAGESRLLHAAVAVLASAGVLVAGLLLEQACRVPGDPN